MKKTFLLKATEWMLVGFTVLGATALVIMVLALCGVPMNWWIGALCVIPACLILVGLATISGHERRKMKNAFIAHHVAELEEMLKELESWDQEEDCRFHEGGKCTFGDGLAECAHETHDEEEHRIEPMACKKITSCEDESVQYLEFPDGIRLISQDGEYVGWYRCEGGEKDGE